MPPLTIGSRRFTVLGAASFGGGPAGAFRYLSRLMPFRLHLVDLTGLTSIEAVDKLYQHLARQGLEWRVLAAGVVEENHEPTPEHALEVEEYLRSLHDVPGMKRRNQALRRLLLGLNTDYGAGTVLKIMKARDANRN